MLSKEENDLLTKVGPGTMLGHLMRQYWIPALMTSELPAVDCPPVRLKLLGEELIGFRVTSGDVGIIQNACPHRGASHVLRPQRRRGPALRLSRLEVRRDRRLRRHALRAGGIATSRARCAPAPTPPPSATA